MHKYIILFFSISLLSCGAKDKSVPNNFIQPAAMAGLLLQIHLIDGTLYNGLQAPDSVYKYGMGRYLETFKTFNTDSSVFRKSLNYYASEPDKLSAIYEQVDLRLKFLTDSVNKLQAKKQAALVDSLKVASAKKAKLKPGKATKRADSVKQLK